MAKNNSDLSGLTNLMQQMQAFSKALNATFQIQELTSAMLDIRQQLIDSIEPVMQSQIQASEMLRSLSIDIAKLAPLLLFDFSNQIENLVSPTLNNFLESFRFLPEHTQVALMTLGNHGWFFDLEMPLPFLWELENALIE